jgi:hypothetical protein
MKKYSIIILTFLPAILFGQSPSKLTESTKDEFEVAQKMEASLSKSDKILKANGAILIKPRQGDPVKFVDNLTDEDYQINEYVGDLIKDKVLLIRTQDYSSDWYVAVDLVTGEQKTFIGFPHIYRDNIICLQGVETDKVQEIEFWKIRNDKLVNVKAFNLSDKIYPSDIVWKNENEIIIRDSKDKFWKMRVDGK